MPVETRLYDVLGVPPDASEADIKKLTRRKPAAKPASGKKIST